MAGTSNEMGLLTTAIFGDLSRGVYPKGGWESNLPRLLKWGLRDWSILIISGESDWNCDAMEQRLMQAQSSSVALL